jgi:predicted CxxxxCH...CXXCH cytochrome family protein
MVALALAGCSSGVRAPDGTERCLTYKDDLAPVFARDCAGCHASPSPAAGVDLTTYENVLAARDRIPPALAEPDHASVAGDRDEIDQWLGACGAAYFHSYIHPGGILDPASADFHGTVIKDSGWNFAPCQKCHGDDWKGGNAGVSCYTCHAEGPTGCSVCHGQPPATGAHLAHTRNVALDCTSCHEKPLVYSDAGHLTPASLVVLPKRGSFSDGRCSGVYCHGGDFTDLSGAPFSDRAAHDNTPLWTGGPSEAACGNCHGIPPSNHARYQCSECHPKVMNADGAILDPSRHDDGKLSLGDESGSCAACHPTDPAKLSGAHLSHMTAPLGLRAPLDCGDCHTVPKAIDDPGHIDRAGGPQIHFGVLATANGSAPTFDGARCANTWCHGAATPAWSDGPSAAWCGACHAVPPADASHNAGMSLNGCVACHASSIDAHGTFVPGGTHLDGVVDAP